ncbi:glycosyltransferase [Mucilaginibacter sp. PAMB04274]|uniref:glycosyltransferase n=1 Tax=Mucilaginibacter sp. PAMB04274 TaxID=3138568 RepID=UPI0031F71227
MIKNRDILVVGQQAWDIEIGSNCKNIALEFSKYNRVLYVNPPLDRITMLRQRHDEKVQKRMAVIRHEQEDLVQLGPNLWNLYPDKLIESINWIKAHWLFDLLNKRNNKLFASAIKKALHVLGFENVIIFNDSDMFRSFYLKELLQPDLSIYYSRDYLLATDYYRHHGKKLEPMLISKSDLCVANSEYLTDYCKKYNPHSYYVGQGCDLTTFTDVDTNVVPADIARIGNPVIGYVGVLFSARLDINILVHIALNNPDWNLVLIGPEDESFINSKLHQLDNVHFLGAKAPAELPAYINAFDVCINPQVLNELTIGNYPRKIDEYLAMGKPVVATKTQAMKVFEKHTYTASTKEEYPALIRKALVEDSPQARINRKGFAAGHTWTNNVNEIYEAIIKAIDINAYNTQKKTTSHHPIP